LSGLHANLPVISVVTGQPPASKVSFQFALELVEEAPVGALRNDSVRIRFDHEGLALEQLFGHVLWRNANSWDFCQTDGGRLRLVGRGVTGRSGQASTDQAETRVEGRSARLVARGTGEAQRLRSCATSLFKRSRVHRHAERYRRRSRAT
jgi:hypothetical protein